jgi:lipopolysaccharide/colanic/teichoic acid biosynthesis glycosyltransferase
VFYGARRQGLHGKPFDCLKFRTMMLQAEAIQYRLRVVNLVDGPQFKIENDPRITGIGKFLRDTCIDELPQFFNVLMGQMSIAGPRPSPANENESCPSWRDARLSVRPGITGLWQVCRTRRNSMDFQEWVHYDTRYVKKLSFRLDLYICFKTAGKLIGNFLDQFG